MKIAVDASGGDYAPHEIIKGAIKAANEFEVDITLVGRRNVIHVIGGKLLKKTRIEIVNATQVIDYNESPMKAVQSKTKSSIVIGTNLVKSGKADAFVSAGNTGAVLVAALMILGRVKGVERPAIGAFLDTILEKPALLVDAGANADCRAAHLLQFAKMGSLYSKRILGLEAP
ncbi:phosphate acyltransferase, partial [Chloroflexota bacterium]